MNGMWAYIMLLRPNFRNHRDWAGWKFVRIVDTYYLLIVDKDLQRQFTFDNYDECVVYINHVKKCTGKKVIPIFDSNFKTIYQKV